MRRSLGLRARIRLLVLGSVLAVLLLSAIPLTLLLHRAAVDDVRGNAIDTAQGVADYVSTSPTRSALKAYVQRANQREDAAAVTIVCSDGTVLGAALPDDDVLGAEKGEEYGDPDDDRFRPTSQVRVVDVDGGTLVAIGVRDPTSTMREADTVVAFEDDDRVRATVLSRLGVAGLAGLAIAALAALAGEIVSRRIARPLAVTADVADALAAGDLSARVPDDGPPEVQAVAGALNRLAGRIDELLIAEREAMADLSHRLRTPLAALRLDVESLAADPARAEVAGDLNARLDQLERTLTEVIRQARRTEREGARPHCEPAAVVVEAVAFWRPLAEDQGRDLVEEIAASVPPVRCTEEDLRAAVDALLENCLAHTEDGVGLAVRLASDGQGRVVLEVGDRGPGFDPAVVLRGRSDRGSTGLGLDIARSLAHATGGDFAVEREGRLPGLDGSWTVVRMTLGPA
ncbi:HAMP domain-containing sensor histidine kinase [Nocardioides fonticola]|uniref:histidine kinase n=1 Tax=Nocardioides fonticola TaxID=450363 RepID=A0ABP7XKG5_9ACTN